MRKQLNKARKLKRHMLQNNNKCLKAKQKNNLQLKMYQLKSKCWLKN